MSKILHLWTWHRIRVAGGLALPLLLPLSGLAAGQLPAAPAPVLLINQEPPTQQSPATTAPEAAAHAYSLAECIQTALQQQPAVNAARSSLAAAETNRRALANLPVPTFLARDLHYRRKQAALGVASSADALDQTERETVYAVTRLYYSVAFAP